MVPRTALSHWAGAEDDYDRAREVLDLVGALDLPDGAEALVLGNEPLRTTYLPEHRTIIRWCYAEREEGVAQIIADGIPTAKWMRGLQFSTTGDLVVFDAAYFGSESGTLTNSTVIHLDAGRYRLGTASIEPGEQTSFRVHRFIELT